MKTTRIRGSAAEGAVEITSIDTVAGTVTGRMAAVYDEDNWVNGNFTVPLAPAD